MFARLEIGVDDLRHVAVLVGDHHAEALVVLDLLHPDDPVRVRLPDLREIRLEDRVDEDDQHVLALDEGLRELHRAGRPVLHGLLDELGRERGKLRPRVFLHLLLQVAGDVDDLGHRPELHQILEDVRHHRLAGDLQHRLRDQVRVRPQPRALPRQRDDDFHGALVPSRPYRSWRRTTSSRCGVLASSTSQSVTASM
jgi:hypothetical protein